MTFFATAKRAAVATVLFALTSSYALAFEIKPFSAAAFKAAQDAGKPILVDVFAPWCPTCKAQHKVFDTLKSKPEFATIEVFQIDFDNQLDAVRAVGAKSQSTLVAYKGATETGRSAGDTNAQSIEALLASTLK